MFGLRGQTRSVAEPTSSSTGGGQAQVAQMRGGASTTSQIDTATGNADRKLKERKRRESATKGRVRNHIDDSSGQDNSVLFLSVNVGSDESVARPIPLGPNDKKTFQCLRGGYKSMSSRWFRSKQATGIKFYRVRSKRSPFSRNFFTSWDVTANTGAVPQFSVQTSTEFILHRRTQGQGAIPRNAGRRI